MTIQIWHKPDTATEIEKLKQQRYELLEALKIYADFPKDAEGQFKKAHWYEVIDAGDIARAAIAKAKGA